jgi:predicted translin family RNA/ssDNA-binding protein
MNSRLTILITNMWLANHAGSEVVVRDLALGLLRRGHRPIVYSPTLGEMADEIRARGVAVIDDLRKLAEAPDILHAHHTIPCGEVLIRFPRVPAVYVCHSFDIWVEAPVHFPQIAAYVAVDEACRDRLVQTEGIDPKHVLIVPNAVDLRRIPLRPQALPATPQRALAFGKASVVTEIGSACKVAGLEYTALGQQVGRISACPEQDLVKFDLVFASARSALEALCCGCAVVVCDGRGMSGIVTSRNFRTLRTRNFGLRTLVEPVTVDRCLAEIRGYDAQEAPRVAEQARCDADLERSLDQFEQLYTEILQGPRRPSFAPEEHAYAVARFLHENLPRRPVDPRWPFMAERQQLQDRIASIEVEVRQERIARDEAIDLVADMRRQLSAGGEVHDRIQRELNEGRIARDEAIELVAELRRQIATASQVHDRIQRELNEGQIARGEAIELVAELRRQLATASQVHGQIQCEMSQARAALSESAAALAGLKNSRMLRLGRFLRRLARRPVPY